MSFDSVVEKIFTIADINSDNQTYCDFIKIPLWDFPMFDGITFNQMKYTIGDLKPSLVPFNAQLKELSEQIFTIPFTSENQDEIKQLCSDKLNQFVKPVQQTI